MERSKHGVGRTRKGVWGCGGEGAKVPEREGRRRRPCGASGADPTGPDSPAAGWSPPSPYPIGPKSGPPASDGAQPDRLRRPISYGGRGLGCGDAGGGRRGESGGAGEGEGGRPHQLRGRVLYRRAAAPDKGRRSRPGPDPAYRQFCLRSSYCSPEMMPILAISSRSSADGKSMLAYSGPV